MAPNLVSAAFAALVASDLPADRQANRLWFAQYAAAAVLVANRIALFDRCAPDTAIPLDELASELRVHAEALLRLCRVLHARELLELDLATRSVALTRQARLYWRRDSVLYRGAQFEEVRPEEPAGPSAPLPYHEDRITKLLRTGRDPARTPKGTFTEMWTQGAVDPEATRSYNEFMRTQSGSVAVHAVRHGVFDGLRHFVDVGGGSALFALAVKAAHPETACTIFDLPEVCDAALAYVRQFPELPVTCFGGSFFADRWPEQADGFNLSNILHDWPPERCAELLERAFRHLRPGGRLVISEVLFDDDHLGPEAAAVFDMLMFMNHGSQQFSFAELARMTAQAGFHGLERRTVCGDYAILVATKPRG